MTSKLALFDIFAMIIPGWIIIVGICICAGCKIPVYIEDLCCGCKVIVENNPPAWVWVVFTVAAYFVGLINNWIADGVFRFFRNNRKLIASELRRVVRMNGVIHLGKFGGNKFDRKKKSSLCLFRSKYYSLRDIFCSCKCCKHKRCKNQKKNPISYYKAYYALSENNRLGSIPILEAQVALIRNCLIPILLFVICFWCNISNHCIIAIIILLILLFIVMVQRQNKVYQMVWEAANYYEL